ncbi:TIGR02117 family protein [Bauldia sp.]|uniref:TIGR02117 family protein n=1 Tax=Bauldia sp. TaxID=2575872 RepID=UPI003BAB8921
MSMIRRVFRIAATGAATLLLLGTLYLAAAVVGALWRPATGAVAAAGEHPVTIVWSEIHTDIVLPVEGLSVDWRDVLDPIQLAALTSDGYVAFGWGSESFYTNVPTMADITPGVIAEAMFFDQTVVHVSPVWDSAQIPPTRRATVWVTDGGLRALEQHVLHSLALDVNGRAAILSDETYGYGDAFYEAHGRYSPIRTCNQWTSEALRAAGVSVGYWTPFAQSIGWTLGADADLPVPSDVDAQG